SIHAPARGATYLKNGIRETQANFNPRTREGCDEFGYKPKSASDQFQSTHPRGVRLKVI
ncbi:hypothetical protein HMPREF1864_01586, partial [Peptoniphilus sp. DNF00840]